MYILVLDYSHHREGGLVVALADMQLMVGVGGSWKCVSVTLADGCVPCIGGVPLAGENIEPALWFKVIVLSAVFVDCSERVISWSVFEDDLHVSSMEVSSSTTQPGSPLTLFDRHHSLMAPVEGSMDPLFCTNDLQSIFELAEVLYRMSVPSTAGPHSIPLVSESISRSSLVEYKSWLRLLHCYLLPLVSLHGNDIEAVDDAHSKHLLVISDLDSQLLALTNQQCHVKKRLSEMLDNVSKKVAEWAENKECSRDFLAVVVSDLKGREEAARGKILSSVKNTDLSRRVDDATLATVEVKMTNEKKEGEQALLHSLMLRSHLEGVASLGDSSANLIPESVTFELQQNYIKLHRELEDLREQTAALSRKKILSLSVREALEQTLRQLRQGQSSRGLDVSLQGGHSTDVLPEASRYSATNEYLTLKDKVHKLIQLQSTALSKEHNSFSQNLRSLFNSLSQIDTEELVPCVNHHFSRVVELVCLHFNDHDQDFMQKAQLCYEKLFFEIFIIDFLHLYQSKHAKYCEQLALNSIGASMIDPINQDLGLRNSSWARLFSVRSFDEAKQLYENLQCSLADSATTVCATSTPQHFEGVLSDLERLALATSPLEQLQFLTSAFRKSMATLSQLKLQTLLEHCTLDQVDASLATVSCDELLPVLVLVLLQCKPSFLSKLHVHFTFLADYTPPFLSPGWHGYSLAAFTSALHIISKL